MLKTISGLQGVTVLSKDSQKKIKGGQSCSYRWQDSNGGWHTEHGHCMHVTVVEKFGGIDPHFYSHEVSFCDTAHHHAPTHLTSNGGKSRCA